MSEDSVFGEFVGVVGEVLVIGEDDIVVESAVQETVVVQLVVFVLFWKQKDLLKLNILVNRYID